MELDTHYISITDILIDDVITHGKLKNVTTVAKTGYADYVVTNYTSDLACLQAVFDAAPSGSLIWVMPGNYYFTNTLTSSEKDLTIVGIGKVNFYFTLPNANDHGIDFAGSTILSGVALTSNAAQGAVYVVLNSVTGVSEGHLILIHNDVKWNDVDDTLTGELYEIKSVNSSTKTVTLMEPLIRDYNTADGSVSTIYNPVKIRVENINFIGTGDTDDKIALYIIYGKECLIEKCNFRHNGLGSVYLATCYDADVNKCKINESEMVSPVSYGYGITVIDACAHIKIYGNTILSCRHCVSCTSHATTQYPGVNRDVIISNNTIHGCVYESGAIDSHPVTNDMTISHNIVHGIGWGINDGSRHSIIDHNEFYSNGGVYIRETHNLPLTTIVDHNIVHKGFLFVDVQASDYDYLQITNNYCYSDDTERYQIQFKNAATGLVIPKTTKSAKVVNISNNRLLGATTYAMRLDFDNFAYPCTVSIHDNQIENAGTISLRLSMNTTYYHLTSIKNNQILNGNRTHGASGPGIYLEGVQDAEIVGNMIYDVDGYTTQGIQEGTGCDYNRIIDNKIKGFSSGLLQVGTNDTIKNNSWQGVLETFGSQEMPTGSTVITVTHGLSKTPTQVFVTTNDDSAGKRFWTHGFTATTFLISIDSTSTSVITFNWLAKVH